ncbi:Dabb family protein [Feifania hominis]|uniref:Dabb family protein n=1 Tax=Feifania hominis TaxID=2763660 RepID=A0A926DDB8_9FIRM|nr:Dabb family protein [Feifania hominis]MBC8536116.1 Dabb family protein [Feifania hominis]
MVRHIVFWNIKADAEGGREHCCKLIKQKLEALVGVVPGLLKLEVGINYNPAGHDLCLLSELTDREALDGYQNHPAHLEAAGYVRSVTEGRAVCDCEF